MPSRSTTLILASLLSLLCVESAIAQQNITVPDTDKSITYSGQGTGDAAFCKLAPDGSLAPGQPGCFNVPSMCAPSAATGFATDAAAEFSFKGSAIYVTGLLDSISPIYTVTLDGKSSDVDGVRPSGPFICSPLFSATNLDPNVNHDIKLSIKGPSPNRNLTISPDGSNLVFGLVNFIYTVGSSSSSTDSNTTSTPSGSKTNSTTSNNSTSTTSDSTTTSPTSPANPATPTSGAGSLSMGKTAGLMLALSSILWVLAANL